MARIFSLSGFLVLLLVVTGSLEAQKEKEAKSAPNKEQADKARELLLNAESRLGAQKIEEANESLRQALPILQKLVSENPTDPIFQRDLGRCFTSLSGVQLAMGNATAAAESSAQALQIFERLSVASPDDEVIRRGLIRASELRTNVLFAEGKREEALAMQRRTQDLQRLADAGLLVEILAEIDLPAVQRVKDDDGDPFLSIPIEIVPRGEERKPLPIPELEPLPTIKLQLPPGPLPKPEVQPEPRPKVDPLPPGPTVKPSPKPKANIDDIFNGFDPKRAPPIVPKAVEDPLPPKPELPPGPAPKFDLPPGPIPKRPPGPMPKIDFGPLKKNETPATAPLDGYKGDPVDKRLRPAVEKARAILWALSNQEPPLALRQAVQEIRNQLPPGTGGVPQRHEIRAGADGAIDAKVKQQVLELQKNLAKFIALLGEAVDELTAAGEKRDKEPRRWQATHDLVLSRLEAELAHLTEYQFCIAQVRADNLPPLGPRTDTGWRLSPRDKMQTTERGARDMAASSQKRWLKVALDHPNTPWSRFAERDLSAPLGLAWRAAKVEASGFGPREVIPVRPPRFPEMDVSLTPFTRRVKETMLSLPGKGFSVRNVVYSPDGRYVAGAARQPLQGEPAGRVVIWDSRTGTEITAVKGYGSVAFHPDGRQFATIAGFGEVQVWNALTGKEIQSLKVPGGDVHTVLYSPDGTQLSAASRFAPDNHGEVRIWDTATWGETRTIKHRNALGQLAYSPDGKYLAADCDGQIVQLWRLDGTELRRFPGRVGTFSPDGSRIAIIGANETNDVWDVEKGAKTLTLNGANSKSMAFNPLGKLLACAGVGGVKLWDAATGKPLGLLTLDEFAPGDTVSNLAFSPDGQRLAGVVDRDSSVKVWCVPLEFLGIGNPDAPLALDALIALKMSAKRLTAEPRYDVDLVDGVTSLDAVIIAKRRLAELAKGK